VLASPAALAQTVSLGFAGGTLTTDTVNQADCNNNAAYRVTWSASGLGSSNVCNNLQIFVTNSTSCPETPTTSTTDGGTGDIILGTVGITDLAAGSGTLDSQQFRDMPALGGNCPDGVDVSNAVCASVNYRAVGATSCSPLNSSTTVTVRYDAKPPVPPTMSLVAQDSVIVVQLGDNGESSLSFYRVQYHAQLSGDAGFVWYSVPDLAATKTSQSITGLTNDQPYVVRAFSLDEVGNLSAATDEQIAIPLASNGFWGEYKAAGGHELGGCNAADATVPSIVGALAVLATLLWRRR